MMKDNILEIYNDAIREHSRLIERLNHLNNDIINKSCYGIEGIGILEGRVYELENTVDRLGRVLDLPSVDLPEADDIDMTPLYMFQSAQRLSNSN